jgi:hypothetical protein
MTTLKSTLTLGVAVVIASVVCSEAALADDPLMGKSPWNFQEQNRAAIARLIKEIEDPGSGGPSTILCGGTSGAGGQGATGSAAQAGANSSCIIVSNSGGAIIDTTQASVGDQTAGSSTSATTNNNNSSKSGGSIDEVADILNGNKQGL